MEISASRPAECRWWGDCKEGSEREREKEKVMSSLRFPNALSLSRGKKQVKTEIETLKQVSSILKPFLGRITGSKNMQLTVIGGMLLHNSWSLC